MTYRIGKKSKLALLDENGLEVAMFRKGYKKQAQQVCDLLNKLETKNREIPYVTSEQMQIINN